MNVQSNTQNGEITMGYMGLSNYVDSDNAADLAYTMQRAMAKELAKGLKEEGNCYNTAGPENVAMVFEAFIIPCREDYKYSDDITNIAVKTLEALQKKIDTDRKSDWDDEGNRAMHINAYKRMAKALKGYIDHVRD